MATAKVPAALEHALAAQARQVNQLSNASAAPAHNDLASQLAAINTNDTAFRFEIQAMNSCFTSARVIDGGHVTFEPAQLGAHMPAVNEESQASPNEEPDLEREAQIPSYILDRNHNSVQVLWDEWTKGLNGHHPSIKNLNTKYGTKWK
ncbi:hypothetical protein [Parasitella parasitica]|uniref:Transcription activator GCR1-like domain-containing protein n=1 Tax=Parasitella parasitica TaxID=35722 RepID=A0A0B7NKA3_9FUNG|nr:hypothetical protein [Parasitella parasitica]